MKKTDHLCIAIKTEFEYLYYKTMEFVEINQRDNYKTLLLEIYAYLMKKNLQEQCNDIFVGQIRDGPRRGRHEFKHHADVKIRLPSDNVAANHVKNKIADFLKAHVDNKYQLIVEGGTCTIYKIYCSGNCDIIYIGQTERKMEKRFDEHLGKTNDVLNSHHNTNGHSLIKDGDRNINSITYCCDDYKRKLQEALYIKHYVVNKQKLFNKSRGEFKKLKLFEYNKDEEQMAESYLGWPKES